MKILSIIADVNPASGGPIEALKLIAAHHHSRGHVNEVVTLDGSSAPHVADFPFKVHTCGPVAHKYGYTSRISRWIAENGSKFDAAVVHGLWNHASVGGWIGLKKAKLPYVIYPHGMMDPWFRKAYPFKHVLKQGFWLFAQGRVLRDAHAVLFTCEEERKLANGSFWGFNYSESVVTYGTNEPPSASAVQLDALYAIVPSLRGRRYLLFLSRIHEKKGCDLLVSAFPGFAKIYPDLDLVIAGPDQVGLKATLQQQSVEAGIAHRIHWPGMLTGNAKWGAFRGAEAFILPSHQENFGIVVAEALACGTPVLITDKVNIWREVQASGGGLVEPDTANGIFSLIDQWLNLGIDAKQSMRANARRAFEAHFRAEKAASDLMTVLEQASAAKI